MSEAVIVGTGITRFGRLPGRTVRTMADEAARQALADAGVGVDDVQGVYFGNAVGGLVTGQEMIRGQVALRDLGLGNVPLVNVENACATGSSAFHLAVTAIKAGQVDLVLVVGSEKLTHDDRNVSFEALRTGADLERLVELEEDLYGPGGAPGSGSFFMDVYADMAKRYAERSGATPADFADVVVKSRDHAALNPIAQFRDRTTRDEVSQSRRISGDLTLPMCSPIGDGAAALVIASAERAARLGADGVRVLAAALASGLSEQEDPTLTAVRAAYETAGLGAADLDLVEVHDAAAPAELIMYEDLGLCAVGDGPKLLANGDTRLGGRVPVNVSGGLISRGHPVGATGCAQLVELSDQIRGRAGDRQVAGARIGMAENGGGFLRRTAAAVHLTILGR
ncbi:thiolase family protein [Pseudonocardia pini]|uniref:thiolase family protein n=1 Tax=Pseudonocardia pini TaxID=2758030 RepID=UPI0015F07107|nr:thiolase family protein [Pseudonocardia pini]